MVREISRYVCQECGVEFPKWSGQCGSCKKWNSLVETVVSKKSSKGIKGTRVSKNAVSVELGKVKVSGNGGREKTRIRELDRVLGGGMVEGEVVLLAGEPGIGKSTLLTQLALRQVQNKRTILYVCGEESPGQVKLRLERIGKGGNREQNRHLLLLAETNVDSIVAEILGLRSKNLRLVIVDSVQTMSTTDLTGMAGSVGQIRESAFRLIEVAKRTMVPVFLVGHVTKGGVIAGPKILEHMVDVVLSLEGDKKYDFRILRGRKNRFGATDEVGIFEMGEKGMMGVDNPGDVFLKERREVVGSVVVVIQAGLRPMLVEIQALVVPTQLAIPRRVSSGIDQRKITLLAAVLNKYCRMRLGERDIFVSVAGGMKIDEPAVDLAVALAIASSYSGKQVRKATVVVGEVGLLGEIRRVGRMKAREKEAIKMGYKRVVSAGKYKTIAEVIKKELS